MFHILRFLCSTLPVTSIVFRIVIVASCGPSCCGLCNYLVFFSLSTSAHARCARPPSRGGFGPGARPRRPKPSSRPRPRVPICEMGVTRRVAVGRGPRRRLSRPACLVLRAGRERRAWPSSPGPRLRAPRGCARAGQPWAGRPSLPLGRRDAGRAPRACREGGGFPACSGPSYTAVLCTCARLSALTCVSRGAWGQRELTQPRHAPAACGAVSGGVLRLDPESRVFAGVCETVIDVACQFV